MGNLRAKTKIGKIIRLNKEVVIIEYRRNSTIQDIERILTNILTWTEQA